MGFIKKRSVKSPITKGMIIKTNPVTGGIPYAERSSEFSGLGIRSGSSAIFKKIMIPSGIPPMTCVTTSRITIIAIHLPISFLPWYTFSKNIQNHFINRSRNWSEYYIKIEIYTIFLSEQTILRKHWKNGSSDNNLYFSPACAGDGINFIDQSVDWFAWRRYLFQFVIVKSCSFHTYIIQCFLVSKILVHLRDFEPLWQSKIATKSLRHKVS